MVSPNLKAQLRNCAIAGEPKFSDHAPFTVDYE
jgi:exonuclease III